MAARARRLALARSARRGCCPAERRARSASTTPARTSTASPTPARARPDRPPTSRRAPTSSISCASTASTSACRPSTPRAPSTVAPCASPTSSRRAPGSRHDAIGLVAHYDSVPSRARRDGRRHRHGGRARSGAPAGRAPRAAPHAGRAAHRRRRIRPDGRGRRDGRRRAAGRLKGYLNLEATGSTGPAILFESGPAQRDADPGLGRAAPRPRGASYALEIYKRLPNDTDFTILKAAGIPGLNFAPVGDSHAYHTSRDTAERVASDTLLHMGETTVTTMRAMDALDRLTGDRDVRFASVGERTVIVLADWQGQLLAVLAIWAWASSPGCGWCGHLAAGDAIRFIATASWGVLALAAAVGAMVGACLAAGGVERGPPSVVRARRCAPAR